ncbi:hypothetical protein A0128_13380 [Leptospira tipperaryensis]|uniref:Uncharacterized protein n=1 Tax=Leptospira tipperaryensis TaxID=2564040 RepID=A0A1D7UYT7_9LEPT|nr:hypothetical protein A0128_13380 [Leptospira tipperaryensis]
MIVNEKDRIFFRLGHSTKGYPDWILCKIIYNKIFVRLLARSSIFKFEKRKKWDCVDGKRIIVYRWEPEMPFLDLDPYHKEESTCRVKTEFESKNGILPIPFKNEFL